MVLLDLFQNSVKSRKSESKDVGVVPCFAFLVNRAAKKQASICESGWFLCSQRMFSLIVSRVKKKLRAV